MSAHVVGICGCGQMGAAAAVSFKRAGYRVLAWTRSIHKTSAIERTVIELETWMERNVGLPPRGGGAIEVLSDLGPIDRDADFVMDCIAEDMEEKAALFRRLTRAAGREAIFLTTTSGLSITDLGRRSGTARQIVGTHFWNPPHLMPLVEVIRGQDTDERAMDRVVELVRSIGKIPVRVNRDVPGFIGNRLLHALWREAISLVERGIASPADVDRVARLTFGLRLPAVGPLENMDLVGLDLVHTIHGYLLADLADDHGPQKLLGDHVKSGELGMKSGRGFYDWRERDPKELVERRDRQIVHQLEFLRELEAL
jgi:3-hydroxybutyryl-CoA dehydrogenase